METSATAAQLPVFKLRSGGFPGKCEKLEKDLRGASKASKFNEFLAYSNCLTQSVASTVKKTLSLRDWMNKPGMNARFPAFTATLGIRSSLQ